MDFLSGKKTYIFAALGAITVGAYFLGFIDVTAANILLGLFGFGGMAALRAGVTKGQ